MPHNAVRYLSLLTIVGVLLLTVVWEFALQPLVGIHLIEPLRWQSDKRSRRQ